VSHPPPTPNPTSTQTPIFTPNLSPQPPITVPCHPHHRAEVLQHELAWMASKGRGGEGVEAVGTRVDYWAL
jgi:hypothetical protein